MAAPDSAGDVLAVAVDGRRSRRALRWAAENLIPGASRVLLVHVVPPICPIPSPSSPATPPAMPLFSSLTSYLSLSNSGENSASSSAWNSGVAEEVLGGEIVEERRRDLAAERNERVKKGFRSFMKLCSNQNKEVQIEVVEEEDVAGAISEFAVRSRVKNLVLGCASFVWWSRMMNGHDVPETVFNSAPATCNVFLVSRLRVVMKTSESSGLPATLQIQKMKSNSFAGEGSSGGRRSRSRSLPIGLNQNYPSANNHTRTDSIFSDGRVLFDSSFRDPKIADTSINDPEVRRSQVHCLRFTHSGDSATPTSEREASDDDEEVGRLRTEIENANFAYRQSCHKLALEKTKVKLISAECSEIEAKLRQAQETERVQQKVAGDERMKHIDAEGIVAEAKQLLAEEALQKYNAEINANREHIEKQMTINALFSSENICRSYSSHEIVTATNDFCQALKIGGGGYGDVYKCCLDKIPVAIKVLREENMGQIEHFLREVEVLTRLRHPHVVLLVGVCAEIGCLVYEYMENESLEDRLSCKNGSKPLPWAKRFNILYEVACTLAFLHDSKPDPIIHCDLKPGNILLDQNYISKIGDVGLAKLAHNIAPDDVTEFRDSEVFGTPCYVDPEYQRTGTVRPKSDLYAFGIIALQMLTNQNPVGLVSDVENALRDGTLSTILDDSVTGWPLEEAEKLARLALECASLRCRDRPDLGSEVIPQLEQILDSLNVRSKQKVVEPCAPKQYCCPLLQEVMDDPCIAMDGYTYERRAIETWFAEHNVSPITKRRLPNSCIIPNNTLRSAIQGWRRLNLELLPSGPLNA